MKTLLLIITTLSFFYCSSSVSSDNKVIDSDSTSNNSDSTHKSFDTIKSLEYFKLKIDSNKTYKEIKNEILKIKKDLKAKNLSKDSISLIFTKVLLNRIIPQWEGTKWSYEGHSRTPQKGEVACGYFLGFTLNDAGVNLNSYKLAQQLPIDEAKSLAIKQDVIIIRDSVRNNILEQISDSISPGIHFIGFNKNHVGYILKHKNELYIIHSDYFNSDGVKIQHVSDSDIFSFCKNYYIVELSNNEKFLEYWLNNKIVEVNTNKY